MNLLYDYIRSIEFSNKLITAMRHNFIEKCIARNIMVDRLSLSTSKTVTTLRWRVWLVRSLILSAKTCLLYYITTNNNKSLQGGLMTTY
jgi:hypothetical protein